MKFKKTLSVALCVATLVSSLAPSLLAADNTLTESVDSEQVIDQTPSARSTIVASGECGENVTYALSDDGVLTISGTGAMNDYSSNSSVPWYDWCWHITSVIIEDGVTTIGNYAFFDCKKLTLITIPNNVTSIGDYAFCYCDKLTSITIPDSVTSIGNSAFKCCSSLTSVTIPNNVTSIGSYAFSDSMSLASVTIGNSVESIGDYAFHYCEKLTSITIPDSVTYIGNSTFYNCTSLKSVHVTDIETWKRILLSAGSSISLSGAKLYLDNGDVIIKSGSCGDNVIWVLYDTGTLVISGTGAMKDYSSSTNASAPWLYYKNSITSVVIENGVTSVGNYAFYDCKSLPSITIPDSVTYIGNSAFYNCTSLESVYVTDIETWKRISFAGDSSNPLYYGAKLYLDNGDIIIKSGSCGDNIKYVLYDTGTLVISGTGAMANYSYSSNVPWYGYRSLITSVIIENGVTFISNYSFYDCTSLTSVTIGSSVESIGSDAFGGCRSIESVYATDIETWKRISFAGDSSNPLYYGAKLYLDNGDVIIKSGSCGDNITYILYDTGILVISGTGAMAKYSYSGNVPWCSYGASITSVIIENGIESISNYAFYNCTSLPSITIPDSVKYIGNSAFYNCTSLESVYVTDIETWKRISFAGDSSNPLYYGAKLYLDNGDVIIKSGSCGDNIKYILYDTGTLVISGTGTMKDYSSSTNASAPWLYYKNSITSVIIESGIESIGDYAFYDCKNLPSITIPDSVTSIGNSAFYNCTSLESINIPDGVTSIGNRVFYNCTALTSVTIGNSVESIGNYAFYGCASLKSINVPDGVKSIGNDAFYGCTNLESINVPDSVKVINNYTFYNCTSLTSVTIGNSVESIGSNAFYGCTSLESINIPDSVKSIDNYSFYNCTSLTSVTIGNSIESIGSYAFDGCTSIESVYATDVEMWKRISFAENTSNPLYYGAKLYLDNGDVIIQAGSCGYNITWLVHEAGKLEISGTGAMKDYSYYSNAPWYNYRDSITSVIIENGVESIGSYAFSGCTNLVSIKIPDSVTSIGDSAFRNCTSLPSITIPDSVTSIGNSAFYNCTSLTSVTIGNSVESIGSNAFSGCTSLTSVNITDIAAWCGISFSNNYANPLSHAKALYLNGELITNLVIPDGVASIGGYAFYNCTALMTITTPQGVTSIGDYAFSGCTNLVSIKIPDSVESIGSSAFNGCTSLESVNIPDSVTSIGDYTFGGCTSLATATIGNGVESIGSSAFNGCTSLESVNIPDSVTGIGNYAFYNCTSLTSVTIPNGVHSIGDYAFSGCTSLATVTIGNSVESIGGSAFYGCTGIESINIPDSVTSIGNRVFYNCTSLASATIGNSVESIGGSAFYNCIRLKSVKIPDSVITIGSSAFYNCTSLDSVNIPDGVTFIGNYTFNKCTSLTSVTIPDSVTYIGEEAFYRCTSLTSVNITDIAAWCSIGFGDEYANPLYYAKNLYLNGELITNIVIPDGVTSIGSYAFYNCTTLMTITIPQGVTGVGSGAFYNCTSLESVNIPDSVTSIGHYTFYNCTSLTSVTIGNSVGYIGTEMFYNCTSLESVNIPDSVTSIGNRAFYNCTSLISVTISDGVQSIGEKTFYNCTSLESITVDENNANYSTDEYGVLFNKDKTVLIQYPAKSQRTTYTIPDSVESIGDYAFFGCTSLEYLTIPDSVRTIGSYAFYDCTSLTSVNITDIAVWCGINFGNGYSYINPLYYAENLYLNGELVRDLVIPDEVTSISNYAFYDCESLITVTISNGVTSIGESAFEGCSHLISVVIPTTVTSIGNEAFYSCYYLISVHYRGTEEEWNAVANNSNLTSADIHFSCTEDIAVGIKAKILEMGKCGDKVVYILTDDGILTILGKGEMNDYDAYFEGDKWDVYCVPAPWEHAPIIKIVIKEGVTKVGTYTFHRCENVTTVTIPQSMLIIGEYAFDECYSLIDVDYCGTEATWASMSIGNGNNELTSAIIRCSDTASTVVLSGQCGENVTYILSDLGELTINGTGDMDNYSAEQAPWYAYASSIKKVIICDGVTSIGDYAFYNCKNLTSITVSNSVTTIGNSAFENCTSIANLYYDGTENAWKAITVKDGNRHLSYTIIRCTDTMSNIITSGRCGAHVIYKLTKDGVMIISGNGPMEDYDPFREVLSPWYNSYSSQIKSIVIEDGVTYISAAAFSSSGVTSVTIPKSVEGIDAYAFSNCSSLTEVYYGGNDVQWDEIFIGELNDCLTSATIYFAEESPILVSGTISGVENTDGLDIEILDENGNVIGTADIVDGKYTISGIEEGETYVMQVSKKNYVTRTYTVTAGSEEVVDVKLNLIGDATGDGVVNIMDVTRATLCFKNKVALSDYEKSCVDINGDGIVNILDVTRINLHFKNKLSLWS